MLIRKCKIEIGTIPSADKNPEKLGLWYIADGSIRCHNPSGK